MAENFKTISQNRKARHDYFIEEVIETGIELFGTEVKSMRLGSVNINDAYVVIRGGEVFVKSMHVSPYEKGNIFNKDPMRERKLLLHKRQTMKLLGEVKRQGYTLIPISVYLKGSLVKVGLALAKGKKNYDKRDDIATRDANRNIDRAFKEKSRY